MFNGSGVFLISIFSVKPFHATGFFLYLLKAAENQKFLDVFRGYIKRPLAWDGLILSSVLPDIWSLPLNLSFSQPSFI